MRHETFGLSWPSSKTHFLGARAHGVGRITPTGEADGGSLSQGLPDTPWRAATPKPNGGIRRGFDDC
jgi:hypothetical protein